MATKNSQMISRIRSTIETAFYANNVINIKSVGEAYELAKTSAGTIVTDMPIYNPEKLGLGPDAKVLLFNDGAVTGRCAQARRIIGQNGLSEDDMSPLVRDAVYESRFKKLYHAEVIVGLDESFMVKAHLLIPEGHENILYNWMMNFQSMTKEYIERYYGSSIYENEGDIFIFSDPDWSNEEYPLGLTLFDPKNNCAALLGMKYFGEHKKGTLTLSWNIANRNGYVACHGGQKRYNLNDGTQFVAGIFGLSGSGKSTLTHYKHENKYDVKILHDDAFVISTEDGSSVALEPAYFDKTQDYPAGSPDNKFLVSAQNCGATRNEAGECVLLTEDIRNGNGRAIKSKFWAPNRVDHFEESINAIIWLMKDPTLPPILKINDPILAATMGATLATKRSTAERLSSGTDMNALVIEPYANPFRTYPLKDDFEKFRKMFEERGTSCFILNTGHFGSKKVTKEITLECLESIVESSGEYIPWGGLEDIQSYNIDGFEPDWNDEDYIQAVTDSFEKRVQFLESNEKAHNDFDTLPHEAVERLKKQIAQLKANLTLHKTA